MALWTPSTKKENNNKTLCKITKSNQGALILGTSNAAIKGSEQRDQKKWQMTEVEI